MASRKKHQLQYLCVCWNNNNNSICSTIRSCKSACAWCSRTRRCCSSLRAKRRIRNGTVVDYGSLGVLIDYGRLGVLIDYWSLGVLIDYSSLGLLIDYSSLGLLVDYSSLRVLIEYDSIENWLITVVLYSIRLLAGTRQSSRRAFPRVPSASVDSSVRQSSLVRMGYGRLLYGVL